MRDSEDLGEQTARRGDEGLRPRRLSDEPHRATSTPAGLLPLPGDVHAVPSAGVRIDEAVAGPASLREPVFGPGATPLPAPGLVAGVAAPGAWVPVGAPDAWGAGGAVRESVPSVLRGATTVQRVSAHLWWVASALLLVAVSLSNRPAGWSSVASNLAICGVTAWLGASGGIARVRGRRPSARYVLHIGICAFFAFAEARYGGGPMYALVPLALAAMLVVAVESRLRHRRHA